MNAVGGQWVQDTLAIPLTRILGCCRDADCMSLRVHTSVALCCGLSI